MPLRIFSRKIFRKNAKRRKINLLLSIFLWGVLFSVFCFLAIFIYFAKDLPRPEKFTEKQFIQSAKIYDRTGTVLLYEVYGEEKRTLVPLSDIPEYMKQVVIATEDANFYDHIGVDFKGIVRSILINMEGQISVGGSTIPQQLIRSTFFTTEKTAERKIREIFLALELDRRYSKEQILEWYLNQVPFGSNSYGVEAASQTYFAKSVSEISVPEAAILAALIQAPSRLSPYGENKGKLLARKDYVLDRMSDVGFITREQSEKFKKEEITFIEKPIQIKAPYFTLWVKQQIEEKYGEDFLKNKGLKIYTSLDWEDQQIAEKVLKEGVERNKAYGAYNGGIVAIDPKTGEILAMSVGSGDYYAPSYPKDCVSGVDCLFDPKFNVVIGSSKNSGRQPGSAFKPFVYATAFNKGFTATTTVIDEQTNFGIWGDEEYIPQNYDGKFRGEVTLRSALAQSLNIPAIKTLRDYAGLGDMFLGLKDSAQTAIDLGITTLNPPYFPSIVLGGQEVKLLDMVSAYGGFATNGLAVPSVSILKIEDSQGNIIEENKKTPKRVLSSEVAKTVNDVLSDNNARAPMFGYSSPLFFPGYQVAVKTGTTQDYRDGWTIGYTPFISVGVWTGNNDNTAMNKEPGTVMAGPIFHGLMEKMLLKYPVTNFEKPQI
jgi:penicillin-binding protein 1A